MALANTRAYLIFLVKTPKVDLVALLRPRCLVERLPSLGFQGSRGVAHPHRSSKMRIL